MMILIDRTLIDVRKSLREGTLHTGVTLRGIAERVLLRSLRIRNSTRSRDHDETVHG